MKVGILPIRQRVPLSLEYSQEQEVFYLSDCPFGEGTLLEFLVELMLTPLSSSLRAVWSLLPSGLVGFMVSFLYSKLPKLLEIFFTGLLLLFNRSAFCNNLPLPLRKKK